MKKLICLTVSLFIFAMTGTVCAGDYTMDLYVAPAAQGDGSGMSEPNAADYLSTSFWNGVQTLLENHDVTVWFKGGSYGTLLTLTDIGRDEHRLTITGVFVWLFTEKIALIGWDFNAVCAPYLPDFMLWEGNLYLPWQMIIYLSVSTLVLVVVSLFTKRIDSEKLDKFYECLRTPVGKDEPETKPFSLPDGIEPAPRRVLVKHPDFEIPVPRLISIVGFVVVGAMVTSLIYGVIWLFRTG